MRLNRVLAMLALVVATGIGLIAVEGHNLRLQQKVTELSRQRELLAEEQARLELTVSRITAPARVQERVNQHNLPLEEPRTPVATQSRGNAPMFMKR